MSKSKKKVAAKSKSKELPKDLFTNPIYKGDKNRWPKMGTNVLNWDGMISAVGHGTFFTLLNGIFPAMSTTQIESERISLSAIYDSLIELQEIVDEARESFEEELATIFEKEPSILIELPENVDLSVEISWDQMYEAIPENVIDVLFQGVRPPNPFAILDQSLYTPEEINDWLNWLDRIANMGLIMFRRHFITVPQST